MICGTCRTLLVMTGSSCAVTLQSEYSTSIGNFIFYRSSRFCFFQRYGVRNSLLLAPMPTASTAQILGNNESIEPYTSNIYTRRVLSGEFQVKHSIFNSLNFVTKVDTSSYMFLKFMLNFERAQFDFVKYTKF